MGKDLTQFLDTLPDQLGRDVQLAPVQVVAIINAIERARQGLYERMTGGGKSDDEDDEASVSLTMLASASPPSSRECPQRQTCCAM